jgi:hypothetical protein
MDHGELFGRFSMKLSLEKKGTLKSYLSFDLQSSFDKIMITDLFQI